MKSEDLLRAMTEVDPALLRECDRVRTKSRHKRMSSAVLLLVAAAILFAVTSVVYYSVKVRENSVGASVETVPGETGDIASEENGGTGKETAESGNEVTFFTPSGKSEGIASLSANVNNIGDGAVQCSCSVVCEEGYTVSVELQLTGVDPALYKSNAVRMETVDLFFTAKVEKGKNYQAGLLI